MTIESGDSARGSHISITCNSVCNWDQESWSMKIVLDCLIALFQGSWSLDFNGVQGTKTATPPYYLRKCIDRFMLVAQNLSWSLDQLLKEGWSLDSIWSRSQTLLQATHMWLPLALYVGTVHTTNMIIQEISKAEKFMSPYNNVLLVFSWRTRPLVVW